jgi:hypothetical protein
VNLEIDRASSRLALPTVEGPSPIAERPSLPPPRSSQVVDRDGTKEDVAWTIEHDVLRRETRATYRYGEPSPADDVAPEIGQRYESTVGVSTVDPGRAWVDASATYELRWPEVAISTSARSHIESDADSYRARIELEASRDGVPHWSERFERRIPRRLQ